MEADAAGVDRIGMDLETLGKAPRQEGLGTWISPHREEQLAQLHERLRHAELFVRVNPLHGESAQEVERVLGYGTRCVMLPMFREAGEVGRFVDLVAGRTTVMLLVETAEAVRNLERILVVEDIDEIHVGLNDLSLSLGIRNRFALLAMSLLEVLARQVHVAGKPLGLSGIGRALDNAPPVPSDLVYAQYPRLGASAALLARSFFVGGTGAVADRVRDCRARLA